MIYCTQGYEIKMRVSTSEELIAIMFIGNKCNYINRHELSHKSIYLKLVVSQSKGMENNIWEFVYRHFFLSKQHTSWLNTK